MEENMPESDVALGGNVRLTGFGEVDNAQMETAKKLISTYAKKFDHHFENLQELALRLKPIHRTEQHQIHNVQARLTINGSTHAAESEDRNLLAALDTVLSKIERATHD